MNAGIDDGNSPDRNPFDKEPKRFVGHIDSIRFENAVAGLGEGYVEEFEARNEISLNPAYTEVAVENAVIVRQDIILERDVKTSRLGVSHERNEDKDNRYAGVIRYAEKPLHEGISALMVQHG